MLKTALHHPRKLWLRRALFQIHLWVGVLLSLYIIVIGLTGSILVFGDEIRHVSFRNVSFDSEHVVPIDALIEKTKKSFPSAHLAFITPPQKENPQWALYLIEAKGKDRTVYADAASGELLTGQHRPFIDFILDLHVNLLTGRRGFIVNCAAGIGLLLLAVTGSVLWWPGIKLWTRGLFVSLHRGWKRINYDVHNAVGIWTLLIVSWWGLTAVYFLFPYKVAAVVNVFSPLVGMKQPVIPEPQPSRAIVPLADVLTSQKIVSPGYLSAIGLPEKPGGNITLYVNRISPEDFSHRDIVTFDGHTGKLLTVWHYGNNQSLGDWFLWLMYPLHFGTLWGLPIKILWSILGLSLPILSITGLVMYWNRYLSVRWRSVF